ncbi:MAG: N-formylglutamate amidohydrolase [Paracoccaceae bacterium]
MSEGDRHVPFRLDMPESWTTSVVFASPHSGRDYPASFLRASVLDERAIRTSEDAFVDQLFGAGPRFGAPLLAARVPRAFIDLNRSADELDPALIEDVRRVTHNPRVSSGLGVVPRVVANGRSIYQGKLSKREAEDRLARYWHPYHTRLQALLDESHARFGETILVDCHSMPHEAIDSICHGRGLRPDIVLGDRFGAAAGNEVVEQVEAAFASVGLVVTRNAPFAGAFTAQHYGRPSREQHVVQVEIDRALYMDEQTIEPNANFEEFKAVITRVVALLAAFGAQQVPLAAE